MDAAAQDEFKIDVGAPADQAALLKGFYQPEGPSRKAGAHPFFKSCTFRWATNEFEFEIDAAPHRPHELALRTRFNNVMTLSLGDRWSAPAFGGDTADYVRRVYIPAAVVGQTGSAGGTAEPSNFVDAGEVGGLALRELFVSDHGPEVVAVVPLAGGRTR